MPKTLHPLSTAALLTAAKSAPWLPGIANGLAQKRWDDLAQAMGADRNNYATSRFLAKSAASPRRIAAEIAVPAAFAKAEPVLLEELDPRDAYDGVGLELASLEDPATAAAVTERLTEAFDVVAEVPSLAESVGQLLCTVHVLKTPDPDTDVSFSDPTVPFSAFVSVPEAIGRVASFRLAEGLIHEAMHLQLTLLEDTLPLVTGDTERHWSVWQQTMRPTRGVLHGYYVFRVLDAFFSKLLPAAEAASQAALHLVGRRRDIAGEIGSTIVELRRSKELTPIGRELLRVLSGRYADPALS